MKLNYALIFSVCTLSTGIGTSGIYAAKATSGEVIASATMLTQQLSQEKAKVKKLEAQIAELQDTVATLKSMLGNTASGNLSQAPQKYIIRSGETITQIAQNHNITREKLMAMNGIKELQQLYIGDELIIPVEVSNADVAAAPSPKPSKLALNKAPAKVKTSAPAPVIKKTPPVEKAATIAWTQSEKPKAAKVPKKETGLEVTRVNVAKVETKTAPSKKAAKKEVLATVAAPQIAAPVKTPIKEAVKETAKAPVEIVKNENKDTGSEKAYTTYKIQFGDNLGKIAKKHGISIGALMSFNNITNANKISGGQKLKIPSKKAAKSLSKIKAAPSPATLAVNVGEDKPQADDKYGIYTVQTGDTLYGLAKDFYTTEKEIQKLNKMGSNTSIVPGQDLIVPTAEYFKKSNLANN